MGQKQENIVKTKHTRKKRHTTNIFNLQSQLAIGIF